MAANVDDENGSRQAVDYSHLPSAIFACSVFLVVGGPPRGEVRLTRGQTSGISTPTIAGDDGEIDDDVEPAANSRSPVGDRHGLRQGSGFGLLPIAFIDRILECATVGGGGNDSSSSSAASGPSGVRWSSLRQCRIPALFAAGGGSVSAPTAVSVPAGQAEKTGGSKRVMSAMQVRQCTTLECLVCI